MRRMLRGDREIAQYEYLSKDNVIAPEGVALNLDQMKLLYTINASQEVSLELYRIKDGWDTGSPINLPYKMDEPLPYWGAYVPEDFLDGDPLGCLAAVRVTDNVAPLTPGEEI